MKLYILDKVFIDRSVVMSDGPYREAGASSPSYNPAGILRSNIKGPRNFKETYIYICFFVLKLGLRKSNRGARWKGRAEKLKQQITSLMDLRKSQVRKDQNNLEWKSVNLIKFSPEIFLTNLGLDISP